MKRAVSYIIAGAVIVALAVYLVFFVDMIDRQRHERLCCGMRIEVADSVSRRFITSSDVASCIRHEYGECVGMPVEEIDLEKIEGILRAKNAVLSAETYVTTDGTLNVEVIQRIPALRFKNDEEDFYADGDGYVFHLQASGTESIMTVRGHFPISVAKDFQGGLEDVAGRNWLASMLNLGKWLVKLEMSGMAMEVEENGDVILRPPVGHPKFVFGRPEDFESRFGRIGEYYSTIVPKVGEEHYSTVILKYDGQIVCRE